jgi:hypothetical protein
MSAPADRELLPAAMSVAQRLLRERRDGRGGKRDQIRIVLAWPARCSSEGDLRYVLLPKGRSLWSGTERATFSPEFKGEAVRLVIESGRPITQIARELQINDGTLGNWVARYRDEHPVSEAPAVVV